MFSQYFLFCVTIIIIIINIILEKRITKGTKGITKMTKSRNTSVTQKSLVLRAAAKVLTDMPFP